MKNTLENEMLDAAISWCDSNGINVLEPEQLASLVNSLYITVRDAAPANLVLVPLRPTRAMEEVFQQDDWQCSDHPDAPHGFSRNASHSAGRYVCDCEGWMPDECQTQPPTSADYAMGYAEGFNDACKPPTPDCRTCWHLHTSDHGDSPYECTSKSDCTNGDQYKPAPNVVLWRTE